ncbi:MAG: HAD family hydrolase [Myxococcota bacterium]
MLKALIFDFDGVIVDTEPLHFEGFLRVMKRYNYTMTYEHYKKNYLAFQDRDCFIGILTELGIRYDEKLLNELIEEKRRWFFPLLKGLPITIRGDKREGECAIQTFEGLTDFVKTATSYYKLAVASGAQRDEIEVILERLNIIKYFEFIVSAGDYLRGKPDPEPYLTAYKRLKEKFLDINIEDCAGIEDSLFGIRSVKSAGMKCIAVTNSYSYELLREYGADIIKDKLSAEELPYNF